MVTDSNINPYKDRHKSDTAREKNPQICALVYNVYEADHMKWTLSVFTARSENLQLPGRMPQARFLDRTRRVCIGILSKLFVS